MQALYLLSAMFVKWVSWWSMLCQWSIFSGIGVAMPLKVRYSPYFMKHVTVPNEIVICQQVLMSAHQQTTSLYDDMCEGVENLCGRLSRGCTMAVDLCCPCLRWALAGEVSWVFYQVVDTRHFAKVVVRNNYVLMLFRHLKEDGCGWMVMLLFYGGF